MFAIIIPLINGVVFAYLSSFVTDSIGDRFILSVLAASASYIAVPAAMKMAVPKATPSEFIFNTKTKNMLRRIFATFKI